MELKWNASSLDFSDMSSHCFEANLDGTVKDNQTGLIWAGQDNGTDINWIDAREYCAGKGAGWHLPTVDQLTAIYDESLPLVGCGFIQSTAVSCHVSQRFKLSGPTFWTSRDHVPAQAWYVLLTEYGGSSGTEHIERSVMRRALCLRSP